MNKPTAKKNNLVTKTYLNQELKLLEMRITLKFDDFAKRIDENAQKYRDQILISNDKVAKELEEMRQENTIGSHQIRQLNDQVDNHEKRIKKLEYVQ